MKKTIFISILTIGMLTLTGCGESDKTIELDLSKIEEKISNLNDGEFSLTMVNTDAMEEFNEPLTYIYDFEYEDMFGVSADSVNGDNSSVKYNSETKELLAIINASDKEDVESSMEKFCEDIKCSISEFGDYLIYVSSSDNDGVIKKVKETNTPIFNEMMDAEGEFFESITNIKETDLEEYLMKVPMMMTSSATYIILKPTEEAYESVKELMDEYMASLESTWEMYLPDQYDLVKNRVELEYGDYLIYIVSSDNELVIDAIKEM